MTNYTTFPTTFDATFGDGRPLTGESAPVEAITELLEGAEQFGVWNTADPNVYKWWDRSQSERGPGQGQPPELYVSSLTGAPIERISAEGALLQEEPTVEIWVYTLSESDTAQLARDVIQFMSEYMDNQEKQSPFVDIVPSNVEDFREQKLAQHTDHFVYQVEISLERLSNTGMA